jgi:hypothetical protein
LVERAEKVPPLKIYSLPAAVSQKNDFTAAAAETSAEFLDTHGYEVKRPARS